MKATQVARALKEKLAQDILESGATYGEVISALSHLRVVYDDKASNLLNGTSIQKVADTPRFMGLKNTEADSLTLAEGTNFDLSK